MKRYVDLLAAAQGRVDERIPWDLASGLAAADAPIVLDVRAGARVELEDRISAGLRATLALPRTL